MKKINLLKKSIILSVLFLSACSFFNFGNNSTPENTNLNDKQSIYSGNNQAGSIESNLNNVLQNQTNANNISDVEILWLIPNEPTEGYILSYGFNENNLDNKIKLISSELQEVTDPVYNKVYRYVLRNIPRNQVIYLQLTAFNRSNFSLPSKIFTLRAN